MLALIGLATPSVGLLGNSLLPDPNTSIERIAFGSCSRTSLPQWYWERAASLRPDLWIWLGDAVYGRDYDEEDLRRKFLLQKDLPEYQAFREKVPIIGVWDDHDYGINDAGADHPYKEKARDWFLDFVDEPEDSPRRTREGIYTSYRFGIPGKQVLIILLDTRFNASPKGRNGTLLGDEQWDWLESELTAPHADVTLIGSSIQVIPTQHRFEKWANFPDERKRLLNLIEVLKVPNLFILSGDRHITEFSRLNLAHSPNGELWEYTSSGLTHPWAKLKQEPNRFRVGDFINQHNFGWIEIDWTARTIRLDVVTRDDGVVVSHTLPLKE
ncbi:MAG: alkaline phosphatase D family protein [Puniceicoccaceae bacterium]